jgi:hypothetical protein
MLPNGFIVMALARGDAVDRDPLRAHTPESKAR